MSALKPQKIPTELLPAIKQRKISDKLPRMCLVERGVVRTHHNLLFSVIQVEGVHVATQSTDVINALDDRWHGFVAGLDQEFAVQGYVVRRKTRADFSIGGHSVFTRAFNQKYLARYQNAQLYRNDLYVVVVYRGMASRLEQFKQHSLKQRVKRLFSDAPSPETDRHLKRSVALLKEKVNLCLSVLGKADFSASETGERSKKDKDNEESFYAHLLDGDDTLPHSEVMGFLGTFLNGLEAVRYAYPDEPLYGFKAALQKRTDNRFNNHGKFSKFPYGNLCEFLATDELAFPTKRYVGFRCNGKIGTLLTPKVYGTVTTPITFRKLLTVDCELVYTVGYRPVTRERALTRVDRTRGKLISSGDKGVSQQEEVAELEDDIASERMRLGEIYTSVMVLGEDREQLDAHVNEIRRLFNEEDFQVVPEGMNTNAAFWAQFPCNFAKVARARLMSSRVFCHFFPMHNFPTGHNHKTHLGEAICLVDTPSKTPMFFNWHARSKGDKNEPVPGHSYIIGANNFGKTTLVLAMDALMEKYGLTSFIFDRDQGCYNYFKATDSPYMVYDPDQAGAVRQNPFALEDTKNNRAFIARLLGMLVREPHETSDIDADIETALTALVDDAYDFVPPEQRCLSVVVDNYLPQDFPRMTQLNRWLRGNDLRRDGKYCEYFDNVTDDVDVRHGAKFGFDLTEVLRTSATLASALTMYIFYKIEQRIALAQSPTMIFFDEGWFFLKDPVFAKWFEESLPTLRKNNAFVILATQSASTILECSVASQYLDNAATGIVAPNSKAEWSVYSKLNISPAEFQFVKHTPIASRKALYKQDHRPAIMQFNLAGFERELAILSSNVNSRQQVRELIDTLGDNASDWLNSFNEVMGYAPYE